MPTQILPAASLRSANRLPAARTPSWAVKYLIFLALWSIARAIFRAAANVVPASRDNIPSGAGNGEVVDPQGRGIGAGLEFEVVGGLEAGEDVLQVAGHRHLADRESDLAFVDPKAGGTPAIVAGDPVAPHPHHLGGLEAARDVGDQRLGAERAWLDPHIGGGGRRRRSGAARGVT